MTIEKLEIRLFRKGDQNEIGQLMKRIQMEFPEPIFIGPSMKISEWISLPGRIFWVACIDGKVIGTIGVLKIEVRSGVLKSLFVSKEFRGKEWGISKALLGLALAWSKTQKISSLFLGTMDQFEAAQKFYSKNRFVQIKKNQLPRNFDFNQLDQKFYRLDLPI